MIKLTSISNHIQGINLSIIVTFKFHQLMLRCHCLVKFSLSGRDGDSNQFQPTGELFLTQTRTYRRQCSLRSPLVQLRYSRGSEQRCTLRDTTSLLGSLGPACPWTHATNWLPAHPYFLECAHFHLPGLGLS